MASIATTNRRIAFLGYGACALASALWGTGFYWGRIALNEMSVESMVLYRFLFACLAMLPVLVFHRRRLRFSASELRLLLVATALGIPVQFLVEFHGLALTTVSHASLVIGAMPVLLAATATLFAKERLDGIGWLALAASTAGAALIVLGGNHAGAAQGKAPLIGDLLVVASLFTGVAWILLCKKLMERHSPLAVSSYTVLSGSLMLALWVLGPHLLSPLTHAHPAPIPFHQLSLTAWAALAISGLLCTATTTLLWNWGIHHVPASRAGVFLNVEPLIGSWLGVALLGEVLGPFAWLGGGLILAAAVTLTLRGSQPDPPMLLE